MTGIRCSLCRQAGSVTGSMDAKSSNYRCPRCGANLLLTRTKELPKGREQAFCPGCAGPLMARDGDDTLGYALVDRNRRPQRHRL
jgi:ribosomal protein S27AE